MYTTQYQTQDLSKYSFLVTGGAGFIGSNLVAYLLRYKAKKVRVLDNLATGSLENLADFKNNPAFEFLEGDIRDLATCKRAMEAIDYVSHQAALGSVPRSINDPIISNEVNVTGFLNMLVAQKESSSVKRFVYAASSSTYSIMTCSSDWYSAVWESYQATISSCVNSGPVSDVSAGTKTALKVLL